MSDVSEIKKFVPSHATSLEDFVRIGSELVLVMAKALVNHPEKVTIDVKVGESTVAFCVAVCPSDFGQILGKHGANAAAMRKILLGLSVKSGHRAVVELVEDALARPHVPKAA